MKDVHGAATAPMTPLAGGSPSVSPPAPESGARRQLSLIEREEAHGRRRRLERALGIGLVAWLGFLVFDFATYTVGVTLALVPFLIVRFGVAIPGAVFYALLRWREVTSTRALRAIELYTFTSAAVGVGVFAVLHEGIDSYYVHSITLVLLAHAAMLGSSWRDALAPVVLVTLAPLFVLGTAALFVPRIAAQWHDVDSFLGFCEAYVLALGAAALTLVGGNTLWTLRQQVREARSLGRYQLKKRIAAGGMGEVWSAYHAALKRDVAVKIVQPRIGRDERVIERFEREVRTLAELSHPHVVRVFDYGATEDGVLYYAMELLDGEDLRRTIEREGKMAPARALRLVRQASEALAEAHARGIVHRDVKPANILVTAAEGGREYVKLIDFGIAKAGDGGETLTETGMVVGTPGYMAPEVICGGEATARSDVYALGAVLYYLLAGKAPFDAETPLAIARAHLDRELPELDAPPAIAAVVTRAMNKDPMARHANAGELAAALRALEA